MSEYKVTASQLKQRSEDLNNLNVRYKTQIDQLSSAETNLNGMWDGEANDAFHNTFLQDINKMKEFYNLIQLYTAKLNSIAARYEQIERTNTQIARDRSY